MSTKRGRPCELTPGLVADAERLASEVEYLESVAALLGINKSTLYAWLKRGSREQRRRDRGHEPRDGEELFLQFSNAVKKGRAVTEQDSLAVINAAAKSGQWQAAAWRLERAHPQRWSLRKQEIAEQRKLLKQLTEEITELRKLIPSGGQIK